MLGVWGVEGLMPQRMTTGFWSEWGNGNECPIPVEDGCLKIPAIALLLIIFNQDMNTEYPMYPNVMVCSCGNYHQCKQYQIIILLLSLEQMFSLLISGSTSCFAFLHLSTIPWWALNITWVSKLLRPQVIYQVLDGGIAAPLGDPDQET